MTVTTQNGQKRTLLLGRVDDAKRVYAKPEGPSSKVVVLLSEADTAKINRDRGGFLVVEKKEEPKKDEPKKGPESEEGRTEERPEKRREQEGVAPSFTLSSGLEERAGGEVRDGSLPSTSPPF